MHDTHAFLQNLALVLCVAAVTTVVFQRLRQPVVFGYLLAGMIVGPHTPIPLTADRGMVEALSETGVVLLMFSLGLEFSLRKLFRVIPNVGLIALAETSVMVWAGFLLGQLFGWTTLECVFAGAIVAISSTTIIVKAFDEQRVRGAFTEVVLGILIVEDLIAIFLLAVLTALSAGGGVSAGSLALTGVRLVTFLVGLVTVGLLLVPRTMRAVVRMGRPETTLVASMGICFAAALLALSFGYSVVLGAFIAGSLVAESGEEKTVEHLVAPVRDVFAAVFFVAVGMLIEPALVVRHWGAVLAFTAVVVAGKAIAVSVASFLTGQSPRTAVQAGMSLAQIGEFSFIIAGVGLASGATREFLYPVAVAVSAITTLTTPWLIRAAAPAAAWVDRKLPRPLQTFVSLYGSWIDGLRQGRGSSSEPPTNEGARRARNRRLVRLLTVDALLIAAVVIGASLETGRSGALLRSWTGLSADAARAVLIGGAVLLVAPLFVGLVRTARRLGYDLAMRAVPASSAARGGVDLAETPRRMLVVTLQLGIVSAAVVPVLAVTQPFLPPLRPALLVLALLAIAGILFWRSATTLQGHARAGAEAIVAALARHSGAAAPRPARAPAGAAAEPATLEQTLAQLRALLPGLGEAVPLRVPDDSGSVGKSLAQLDLRGVTGATVLAIVRTDGRGSSDEQQVLMPAGAEVIHAGDLLALAGSAEAVGAARSLLSAPPGVGISLTT
ncbi:MAG TPA: cation:proton antiporter [Gemmatimonadaceae bacterium]|nr:cation:proton antiporter [Gemmatimonadaceae bacterium]